MAFVYIADGPAEDGRNPVCLLVIYPLVLAKPPCSHERCESRNNR